jgi:hypothetical protein
MECKRAKTINMREIGKKTRCTAQENRPITTRTVILSNSTSVNSKMVLKTVTVSTVGLTVAYTRVNGVRVR